MAENSIRQHQHELVNVKQPFIFNSKDHPFWLILPEWRQGNSIATLGLLSGD